MEVAFGIRQDAEGRSCTPRKNMAFVTVVPNGVGEPRFPGDCISRLAVPPCTESNKANKIRVAILAGNCSAISDEQKKWMRGHRKTCWFCDLAIAEKACPSIN